ncbi:MarR family protein [compost metagenome]
MSNQPSSPSRPDERRSEGGGPWLFYLLKRWYSAGHAKVEEVTRAFGMTAADYSMLATLARKGPCSAADLARTARITPQAVTQQVVQLESKGLVVRYENEANRRITLIETSTSGRENLAAIDQQVASIERAFLAEIPVEQEAAVRAFLSRPPVFNP